MNDTTERAVALWMMGQGYATGHGDTLGDLLGELVHQVHANALLEAHNNAATSPERIAELQYEAGMYRSLYDAQRSSDISATLPRAAQELADRIAELDGGFPPRKGERYGIYLNREEMETAIAALRAVPCFDNTGQWRPIGTAPMDGSRCDVWSVYTNKNGSRGQRYIDAQFREHEQSWFDLWGNRLDWEKIEKDDGSLSGRKTTHWMPTPADPTAVSRPNGNTGDATHPSQDRCTS